MTISKRGRQDVPYGSVVAVYLTNASLNFQVAKVIAPLQVYHSHDPGRLIADMTGQTGGDRVWYGGEGG